jgi:sec-independent protein translocase protein TatB
MGGLDPAKVLIVLVLAIIILGPEKLPKVARQMGAAWRQIAQFRQRLEQEVREAIPDLDLPKLPVIPSRGIAGYLTGMMTSAASSENKPAITGNGAGMSAAELLGTDQEAQLSASEMTSDRSPRRTGAWQSSTPVAAGEPSELPAGWHAVGGTGPGYASGSVLAPVPSLAAPGLLSAESTLSFDEPSWN